MGLTPLAYQPPLLGEVLLPPEINTPKGTENLQDWISNLEGGFILICFQYLSLPNLTTQLMRLVPQLVHQRFVHSGPLVLGAAPLKYPYAHDGLGPYCLTTY